MFLQRIHLVTLIAATCMVSVMGIVFAADPGSDKLQTKTTEPGRSSGDLSGIPYLLMTLFPVPVSFEGHPSYSRKEEAPFNVEFQVTRNESLESCLDRLVAASRGLLTWNTIHDNIVIMPKKQKDDEKLNAMDTKISLEVKDATPWEALKALEKAVNSTSGAARKVQIIPDPLRDIKKPLAEFTESHSISLKLDNVTARETVCAIMAASPVPLCYLYTDTPIGVDTDTLLIFMYKDGKVANAGRMPIEEAQAWNLQLKQ